MREEKKIREVVLCPVCNGTVSITHRVEANGISTPLSISGRGGSYTITWTLGYGENDRYITCTCASKPDTIEGTLTTWLGEIEMKTWDAYSTIFSLEDEWLEKQEDEHKMTGSGC